MAETAAATTTTAAIPAMGPPPGKIKTVSEPAAKRRPLGLKVQPEGVPEGLRGRKREEKKKKKA